MNGEKLVCASVSVGDAKVEFTGSPEQVLASISGFLTKQVPNLNLAYKITINYSLGELINLFGDMVKLTPEGPRIWAEGSKLSDKHVVALQLVGAKIGHEAGKLPSPTLTLSQIQEATGLNPKSISSRLSELVKMGHVSRETSDKAAAYKLTTSGMHWLSTILTGKGSQ